jgi:thioredoxin 1
MKSIAIIVSSLVMIFSSASFPTENEKQNAEGIQFESGSWNEVLQLAKKENKLIFLDMYASWCGPCKLLKSRTFPDENVGAFFNKNFINYAIDAEKGEGVQLARKYNITGYPTLLFVNSNGELVARTMGYHNPEQLLEVGQKIIDMKP